MWDPLSFKATNLCCDRMITYHCQVVAFTRTISFYIAYFVVFNSYYDVYDAYRKGKMVSNHPNRAQKDSSSGKVCFNFPCGLGM